MINEKGGERNEPVYVVSTVFLGLDYSHFGKPPIVWETAVFTNGRDGLWFDRCSGSREQAYAMHENMCRKIKNRLRHMNSRIV